jgi:hypothetical protein
MNNPLGESIMKIANLMDYLLVFGRKILSNHENGLLIPFQSLYPSVALLHNLLQDFSETSIGLEERRDMHAYPLLLHKK